MDTAHLTPPPLLQSLLLYQPASVRGFQVDSLAKDSALIVLFGLLGSIMQYFFHPTLSLSTGNHSTFESDAPPCKRLKKCSMQFLRQSTQIHAQSEEDTASVLNITWAKSQGSPPLSAARKTLRERPFNLRLTCTSSLLTDRARR